MLLIVITTVADLQSLMEYLFKHFASFPIFCSADRPRRAAVLNYFADGVLSNTDKPLLCMEGNPAFHAAANIPKVRLFSSFLM